MKKILFSAVLLASISFQSFAQGKYQWKDVVDGAYTYKTVTGDPTKAKFYTLANGLTVILSENKKTPRIQTLIGTRAGSNNDPKNHTGLAHYLEHMLFKGTTKYGSLDWAKEKPILDKIDVLYDQYNKIALSDTTARKAKYHEIDSVSGEAAKYAIANEYDKMMSAIGAQGTNAHTWVEETVYEENIPANAIDQYLAIEAERFRAPVLRLFHTELEAVYEEKNIGLDNDGRKVYEALLKAVFPTHNYGQQSTIGTVEHLKNPSLYAIKDFYSKYYVPNNMALVMVGDFKAEEVIKKIDVAFKWWQPKPVTPYIAAPEKPLTTAVVRDVYGPTAESINIGWRMPGGTSFKESVMVELIANILANGKAGLIDLNLNKEQKVLKASAYNYNLKDYGLLVVNGSPKEGQTLDEVKALLMAQIDLLKKGEFDASLITSTVANYKLDKLESIKDINSTASEIMASFIQEKGKMWDRKVAFLDAMKAVTKEELVTFINKYVGDGNVVIYKHKGEDKNIVKVPKPAITPVSVNRDAQSPFLQKIENMPTAPLKPLFLDYAKDVQKSTIGAATVYYSQNKDNEIFRLYYRINMGTWNNKMLGAATQYLEFLGTDKYAAADISKEFYKLACSFNINAGTEYTTISITGLQENFEKAVTLFEEVIKNCKPDEGALKKLVARIQKARKDNKSNKRSIMSGLTNYASYGAKNPYNYVLSNDELNNMQATDLVAILHNLGSFKHDIIYYGPQPLAGFTTSIAKLHPLPAVFTPNPTAAVYRPQQQTANKVLFAQYDMVQAEIRWIKNTEPFDPTQLATIDVFNNYFGAGSMSGIVFQTIRESKALAYSTFAVYNKPVKKENPFTFLAYVGTQADKMNDAVKSMNELINDLPKADKLFDDAKTAIKKDIESERITDEAVIFNYLDNQRLGINYDIRKNIYTDVDKLSFADIKAFTQKQISSKPYTYCIVASDKKINLDDLKQYGEVQKLSLEEIFGY
ncbi:M16 family metallopeptidase [Parasediminibacterium sp. JCM 36343]|uniref:M16 family metallopeptidase n=1 Tax=Parasediminibacterium sp. JCM 36343 TaxID=3374279 RepID=UPI00397A8468